jgi:hypothetical protein
MKLITELIVELGGVALIFGAGWVFPRVTGYGKFYDKMIQKDKNLTDLITNNNKENDEDMTHQVLIKKRIQNENNSFNADNN